MSFYSSVTLHVTQTVIATFHISIILQYHWRTQIYIYTDTTELQFEERLFIYLYICPQLLLSTELQILVSELPLGA